MFTIVRNPIFVNNEFLYFSKNVSSGDRSAPLEEPKIHPPVGASPALPKALTDHSFSLAVNLQKTLRNYFFSNNSMPRFLPLKVMRRS